MKFLLNQNQFSSFRNTLITRTAPVLFIPVIAGLLISKPSWETAPILIPIILATFAFVLWNMVKKQQRAWETFELIISENDIKRHQEGFPSIVNPKDSIVKAIVGKNGAITLIANPKSSSIIVPFSVINQEELLREVSTFTTISEAKNNNGILITYGTMIIGLLLVFTFMLSTTFYLTAITGLILATLCIWSFIQIQKNKNFDRKVKKASYAGAILILLILSKLFIQWSQFNS